MSDSSTPSADATRLGSSAPHTATGDYYAHSPGQRAPWHERLKQRKITIRKVSLYALVITLFALSSPTLPTFIGGAILVTAGLALRIWTFGHLEKNQHMITSGPYAHSRNPAYLGSFLIVCGFVLAAGNPFSIAGALVWALGLAMLVVFFRSYLPRKYAREYPRLKEAFPDGFKTHAANVPDFFPRLRPWRSGDTRRFSWACVNANHELWWTTGLSLGLALLWLG